MHARLCQAMMLATLAGLVSCVGEIGGIDEPLPSSAEDACSATSLRENQDDVKPDCLDIPGIRGVSAQEQPVALQAQEPDYAELTLNPRIFRGGFSISGELFEMDELEREVLRRVWMPCLSLAMINTDPSRQELRAVNLDADTMDAVLGIELESRTRELASIARDMSGPERESFFDEQAGDCLVDIIE